MHDYSDLYNVIKLAAMKAVEASKPSDFLFGKVTKVSPLEIIIEQRLTLDIDQLVLPEKMTDYSINFTVDGVMKRMTVHNGLKIGDEVILIKKKGGQKYLIFDKVVNT